MGEITFESFKEEVEELSRELDLAIALVTLSKRFYRDERIPKKFDNTYEAHAFALCRHSVDYSLVLSICRCHDKRQDSHGLTNFFQNLKNYSTKIQVKEGIYARRLLHVNEDEALADVDDHMQQLDKARELHITLKGSHQYDLVRDFRHKFIAHRGKDKAKASSTEKEHLYHLVEKTKEIMDLLTSAILGSHESFEDGSKIWEMYSGKFFDRLMTGQTGE